MKSSRIHARFGAMTLAILIGLTGSVVAEDSAPLIILDNVPLPDANRNPARQADLNYLLAPHVPDSEFGPGRSLSKPIASGHWASFDPKVTALAFVGQGTVSFLWRQITLRQALAAVLDNYGLTMVEDAATSTARISLKPEKKNQRELVGLP
jgi:hypothetical protein